MADAAATTNISKGSAGADGGGVDLAGGGIAESCTGACRETIGRLKWLWSCMRMA